MGTNKYITNANVVLFLGAGASQPLGKWLMNEFIEALWEEVPQYEDARQTLGAITEIAGPDLEAILEMIDSICSSEYVVENSKTPSPYPQGATVLKLIESANFETGIKSHWAEAFHTYYTRLIYYCYELRRKIEDVIFDHYSQIDAARAYGLYAPILHWAASKVNAGSVLPVFTTNYDPAIETVASPETSRFDIINGFRPSGPQMQVYDASVYDSFEPPKNSPVTWIVLFKLHGSVFWFKDRDGLIKYTPLTVPVRNGIRKNVIIYPAKRKTELYPPCLDAYDYLQRCLDNARRAIFIGYSFRDDDTVTRIKSALRHNTELKVAILDPKAEDIIKDKFQAEAERIKSLRYRFGEEQNKTKYLNAVELFILAP